MRDVLRFNFSYVAPSRARARRSAVVAVRLFEVHSVTLCKQGLLDGDLSSCPRRRRLPLRRIAPAQSRGGSILALLGSRQT